MSIARRWLVAGALALAAGTSGCASGVQAPPAESLTSTRTPGRFVWHDLVTTDLAAAKKFYGGLLGWTFEDVDGTKGRYVFIRHDGRVIGGMAEVKSGINTSQWLSHISTANVDGVAKAALANGGRVAIKPFDIGKGRARLAVLVDPEGAPFGAVTLTPGDPAAREAAENEWLWHELWTADKPKATQFYAGLFGYQPGTRSFPAGNYEVLAYGSELRAGLQQLPNANVRPNWLPYVRVQSAKALAARATELGGTVLVPPQEKLRNGTVALVQDPTGAAVALQEWPVKSVGGR
jgi:predicted enzyme related to lactoylglutathione lyase